MKRCARNQLLAKIAAAMGRLAIAPGEVLLLGLSGGPDSVALLHAMIALRPRLRYRLAAAHFNHRVRGAESDRDENFVRELCRELGVELTVGHADGLGNRKGNLEERARQARHAFLRRTAERVGASRIALAHHAGDQAETVMLRLLRGAGAAGLGAMGEAGPGKLIRPMLAVERGEILDYLKRIGARFVTDSSNSSPALARNRIRAELIPALAREYGGGLPRRLAALAAEMRSLDDLVTALADVELRRAATSDGALDVTRLARLHPALLAAVIRGFLRSGIGDLRRVGRAHIEAVCRLVLAGPPNGSIDIPGGWRVERQYGTIGLGRGAPRRAARHSAALKISGKEVAPVREAGFLLEGEIVVGKAPAMPESLFEAIFDADRLAGGITLRTWAPGDRVRPLGMDGHRKVKDIFIDRKVPRALRAAFPMVAIGSEIAWIPGLIRGHVAAVTSATRRVLNLRATPVAPARSGIRLNSIVA